MTASRPILKLQRRDIDRTAWQRQAALAIRIDGRHFSDEGLQAHEMSFKDMADEYIVPEELARTAFLAGIEDRKLGLPCVCNACSFATRKLQDREGRRNEYSARRREELAAQGLSEDEVRRRVAVEIDFGAAL